MVQCAEITGCLKFFPACTDTAKCAVAAQWNTAAWDLRRIYLRRTSNLRFFTSAFFTLSLAILLFTSLPAKAQEKAEGADKQAVTGGATGEKTGATTPSVATGGATGPATGGATTATPEQPEWNTQKVPLPRIPKPVYHGYSGYIGGGIYTYSADAGVTSYYFTTVLNYSGFRYDSGLELDLAYGDKLGTGNSDKFYFLDRFEFKTKNKSLIPFFDIYAYRNPSEGYLYRMAAGPGVGFYMVNTAHIRLRGNVFAYMDEDNVPPNNLQTYFDRGLAGAEGTLQIFFTKRLTFSTDITGMSAMDRTIDFNVNLTGLLNYAISNNFIIQLKYDQKYHNLLVVGFPAWSSATTFLIAYGF
jgi:hypothetical protein